MCKKGYVEITKKIYLETLKSVLDSSISHYSAGNENIVLNYPKRFLGLDRYHTHNLQTDLEVKGQQ